MYGVAGVALCSNRDIWCSQCSTRVALNRDVWCSWCSNRRLKRVTSSINCVSINHAFRPYPVMPCAAQSCMPQLRVGKGRQVHQLMAACRLWMQPFKYCSSYSASAYVLGMCSRELHIVRYALFTKTYSQCLANVVVYMYMLCTDVHSLSGHNISELLPRVRVQGVKQSVLSVVCHHENCQISTFRHLSNS